MRRRPASDGFDAERLLRDFYAAEIAASENRAPARSAEAPAPVGAAEGGNPVAYRARRAPRGVVGPALAAAASIAALAAGALAPRPVRVDVPGLYLMVDTFGELAKGAGLLAPFGSGR